jgi:hypothetical protein
MLNGFWFLGSGRLMKVLSAVGLLTISALTALDAAPASAAAVTNINSTITNAGNCVAVPSPPPYCAESYQTTASTGTPTFNNTLYSSATQTINVPPKQSFQFGDSFNEAGNASTGSDFGSSAYYNGNTGPWNFQDNILFTTNGGNVQAQASALITDITGLQARIISLNMPSPPNPPGTMFDVTNASQAAALLSGNGVVTVQSGWQTFTGGPIDFTATMKNIVAPGSYILQIRGEAGAGSSYSGTINFTPVPLPGAAWLLLSALGGLVPTLGIRSRKDVPQPSH